MQRTCYILFRGGGYRGDVVDSRPRHKQLALFRV